MEKPAMDGRFLFLPLDSRCSRWYAVPNDSGGTDMNLFKNATVRMILTGISRLGRRRLR